MNNDASFDMRVTFNNTVLNSLKQRNTATSIRDPEIKLSMQTNYTGPFSHNWLYLSAWKQTNYWGTAEMSLMPFRPDMVTVSSMMFEGIQTQWVTLEDISEYRSWSHATRCVVAMSGDVYGGTLVIDEVKPPFEIWTKKFYSNNLVAESARLVPLVPGRVSGVEVDEDIIKVDIKYDFGSIMTRFANLAPYDPNITPDSIVIDALMAMSTTQNEAHWDVISRR